MDPVQSKLASAAIGAAAGPAQKAIKKWGTRKYDQFIVNYTNAFSENVQKSLDKCKVVRNVLYRNQLASTDEKYVSISFRDMNYDEATDKFVLAKLLAGTSVIVRGRGGAGKTMFTKWCVLRLIETLANHQRIPIYVELRDVKDYSTASFEEIIFGYFTTNRSRNNFSQFLEGLKCGLFVFVLDAADEVSKEFRSDLCKKIEKFHHTYPECAVLLTSRHFGNCILDKARLIMQNNLHGHHRTPLH